MTHAAVIEEVNVDRGVTERSADVRAVEAPIALVYHGVPHVVPLATPADLEERVYCQRADTDEAWRFE